MSDESITLLAPPWGSALDFGGRGIRARIALPRGVVRPKSMLNLHLNQHTHAESDDSNTKNGCTYGVLWGDSIGDFWYPRDRINRYQAIKFWVRCVGEANLAETTTPVQQISPARHQQHDHAKYTMITPNAP